MDDCEVACGSDGEQLFREAMGYVALILGLSTAVLALLSRRWVAVGTFVLAAIWAGGDHRSPVAPELTALRQGRRRNSIAIHAGRKPSRA